MTLNRYAQGPALSWHRRRIQRLESSLAVAHDLLRQRGVIVHRLEDGRHAYVIPPEAHTPEPRRTWWDRLIGR